MKARTKILMNGRTTDEAKNMNQTIEGDKATLLQAGEMRNIHAVNRQIYDKSSQMDFSLHHKGGAVLSRSSLISADWML